MKKSKKELKHLLREAKADVCILKNHRTYMVREDKAKHDIICKQRAEIATLQAQAAAPIEVTKDMVQAARRMHSIHWLGIEDAMFDILTAALEARSKEPTP